MSLTLRWIDDSDFDRLALTRLRCYGLSMSDLAKFRAMINDDARAQPGDFLLAERNGEAVGTTTSLSMTMWVRGAPLPCQGVAWVGTIRTARREGRDASSGVATQLMHETLAKARERGQVVSALMPFRASFYEHFGYGIVEHRRQWFVPTSILPKGDAHGIRYLDSHRDLPAMKSARQQQVRTGQCDVETSDRSWPNYVREMQSGFAYFDGDTGQGWMLAVEEKVDDQRCLRIAEQVYSSPEAFHRQLHFLAGLKDQFFGVILTLPTDLPLHHLLKETQVPHRPVAHATAQVTLQTRMQVRILDHGNFFAGQIFPEMIRGEAVIQVRECEGTTSRFLLQIECGHATAGPTDASPQFECTDAVWASIACGELRATMAVYGKLATCSNDSVMTFLDLVSASGSAPFCREYF